MSGGWCLSEDEGDDLILYENELTEEDKERTISLLKEAIDTFDSSKKRAYLEASSKGIVETESDPKCFLRLARYDPWHAAMVLIDFWEQRVSLFGWDRAFRKLFDLSGDGCLNEDDIDVLQSGFYCDVPTDEFGHSVVVVDRRRLSEQQHATMWTSQIRAAFYVLMKCARNPVSQTEGIVGLVNFAFEREDPRFLIPLIKISPGSLPFKMHRLHLLYSIQTFDLRFPFFTLPKDLKKRWDQAYERYKPPSSRRFHFGRGPEDFLPQLLSHGLTMDGIPQSLGGTWNYSNFTCHCEMQKKFTISKTMNRNKSYISDSVRTLSWPELVRCVLGNLRSELIDSWIWDIQVARLKKALFGTRASLAVNATGSGALTMTDVYALNTYYLQILAKDNQGRTVISFESHRVHVTVDEQMRAFFYMLSIAAENPMSFDKGIVLLIVLDSQFFLKSFGLEYMSEMLEVFQMPAVVHVFLESPSFEMPSIVFRSNIPIRLGSLIAGPNVYIHDLADDLVQSMKTKYGLVVLPESVGGTWKRDDYEAWRRDRHMLELSNEFASVFPLSAKQRFH